MSAKKKISSFDVFDTCVSRMHAYPHDLFYALGLSLAPELSSSANRASFAKKFQRARIRAEKIANWRKRPTSESASLHDVYATFRWLFHTPYSNEYLVQAESSMEQESIYAIGSTSRELEKLRQAGNRIVFVSDMYLPSTILSPILREVGVNANPDSLYVSCDSGVTKHSGKLFDYVLLTEGILPSELTHTGDNLWADVAMATQKGIVAKHFNAAALNSHEVRIAGNRLPRTPGKSYLAALSRRSRLTVPYLSADTAHPLDPLIHATIIPLLISYVLWVLSHARQHGIKRLYFVAREGEILYKIANELKAVGAPLELCYLHGSRRAWLAPSIRMDAMAWRKMLITTGQSNSRRDIVARTGLNDTETENICQILGISPVSWGEELSIVSATEFLEVLLSNEKCLEIISSSAAKKREVALSYFKQEGLLDDLSWALVDSGWSLNSQSALKRILSEIAPHEPKGYYLALGRDHLSKELAGTAYPFIPLPGSFLSRRRVIVEHCFMPSLHATTQGYFRNGQRTYPILGQELRSTAELEYASRLHEAATSTARMVASNSEMQTMLRTYRSDVLQNVEDFLHHPSTIDVEAMASFGTVADLRHDAEFVEPLCRPLVIGDVWRIVLMTFSKRRSSKLPAYMWLEGSCALSPSHIRLLLRIMLFADSLRNFRASVPISD